jgi:6-pyruvoyltetrahydropterin/6-carboxytetrahydropterin synthase
MYELHVTTEFSAAHHLCGYGEPCEQVHGHNWKVVAYAHCEKLDEVGLGIDFKQLRGRLREVLAALDHHDLNATPPFDKLNPSAENLARWIFDQLTAKLSGTPARLHRIMVCENEGSGASYVDE